MRSVTVSLRLAACLVAATLLLGGCGLMPDQQDETLGWSANKLYAEAKDAMSTGAYDKAVTYFEKLESRYPYGRYAQQAQIEVAYAYYKQDEDALAVAACDRFLRLHPNHPNADYAYYLKGIANFNEDLGILGYVSGQDLSERDPKAAKDSFNAFRELITKYPDSKYDADARLRMNYLVNALASYEVHVAKYYVKRGAYVAAIGRAQNAIKSYPNTPATEGAIFVMIVSYDALGMTDLRDDSARIMRANFPDSEYFKHGLYKPEAWWKLW